MELLVPVGFEFETFLYALLLGFVLGLVYEVFRILRMVLPWGSVLVAIQDILYWIGAGAVTFLFFMRFTSGMIRGYVLLGEGLGLLLYFLTLGRLIHALTAAIIDLVARFLRLLYRLFIVPVRKFFGFLGRKSGKIYKKAVSGAKRAANKHNFHLKDKRIVLYNLLKRPKKPEDSSPSAGRSHPSRRRQRAAAAKPAPAKKARKSHEKRQER